MAIYDRIYDIAADNYGLVTSSEAKEVGASDKELSRLASDGRLVRLGRGLYRIKHHVSEPFDQYAEAVALAGPGAYLFGESVISMLGLAPTNPKRMTVATTRRVRRRLPSWLKVNRREPGDTITAYEGIPSQSAQEAIASCKGKMMADRLIEAAKEARERGYLTDAEERDLLILLEDEHEKTQ